MWLPAPQSKPTTSTVFAVPPVSMADVGLDPEPCAVSSSGTVHFTKSGAVPGQVLCIIRYLILGQVLSVLHMAQDFMLCLV
jgi:hypothetical protein